MLGILFNHFGHHWHPFPVFVWFGTLEGLADMFTAVVPDVHVVGKDTGGPAVMVWGWLVVGASAVLLPRKLQCPYFYLACFTMLVGLAMAGDFRFLPMLRPRITDWPPLVRSNLRDMQVWRGWRTASFVEQWISFRKLVPTQRPEALTFGRRCCLERKTRHLRPGSLVCPLFSLISVYCLVTNFPKGWFNLLGQVAVTTGISYACANFISTACTLGHTGFVPTPKTTIGRIPWAHALLILCWIIGLSRYLCRSSY